MSTRTLPGRLEKGDCVMDAVAEGDELTLVDGVAVDDTEAVLEPVLVPVLVTEAVIPGLSDEVGTGVPVVESEIDMLGLAVVEMETLIEAVLETDAVPEAEGVLQMNGHATSSSSNVNDTLRRAHLLPACR